MKHFGVSLRRRHFSAIEQSDILRRDACDCVEIISENFMGFGGRPAAVLAEASKQAQVLMHGVNLSIGGLAEPDAAYIDALGELAARVDAPYVSDHLAISSDGRRHWHELLPVPFTGEMVTHIAKRVRWLSKTLGRPLVLENPSVYFYVPGAEMDEATFLRRVVEASDCGLLLDFNNLCVNAAHHAFAPEAYLEALPLEAVREVHLACAEPGSFGPIDSHCGLPDARTTALYEAWAAALPEETRVILEWETGEPELAPLLDAYAGWREGLADAA